MSAFCEKRMAEKALMKLEEQLNCPICLDAYNDPKLLKCFHVYCRKCLVPLVDRGEQGQLSITCPTCRHSTPISEQGPGVSGLQSAFHINNLLEFQDSIKKIRNSPVILEGIVLTESKSLIKKVRYCTVHKDRELELYCETCEKLICLRCIMKGDMHHSHEYEDLNKSFDKYKEEITSSLEPMEKHAETVKKALANLNTRCREITDQQSVAKNEIRDGFTQIRDVLRVREGELLTQVEELAQEKLKGLEIQRGQMDFTLAQLTSCINFTRESIKTNNKEDALMMKMSTVKQVKELMTSFKSDFLEPNTKADISFSVTADVTALCKDYGKVLSCYVTGDNLEAAIVGEKSIAILHAMDFKSKPCKECIKSIACELIHESTGSRTVCSVERRGQGNQYEISYMPNIKGKHQLHIKLSSKHIMGIPLSVAVMSSAEKLSMPILIIPGIGEPWGIAVNQRGEMMVTEEYGHCVSVLSHTGLKLRSLGVTGSGSGQEQFQNPRGIRFDSKGNILVADWGNSRIQKLSTEGIFFETVCAVNSGPLQRFFPTDIALNTTNNKVYVSDEDNHRIQILNADLTFSNTFGKPGCDKGEFSCPRGIACDSSGKVYVADSFNHRIQVFTAAGNFLRMFGRRGQGRGELDVPSCIAVDTDDNVYVTEGYNHRVSIFTSEGNFVAMFGKWGEGPGEFNGPYGIAVHCKTVYVCDCHNNRVQVF